MSDLTPDGNAEAPGDAQVNAQQENPVNPGAIRKSATAGVLNALSAAAGVQFESVEAAVAAIARLSAQQANVGNVQPETKPKQTTKPSNDLQEQFHALQQKLAAKDRALQETTLDQDIRSVMGNKFDTDLMDYALSKVKTSIQWSEDGTYTIVNSKGQERYSQSGEPLTLAGLVDEVARSNPKLLKQQNTGGSGLRPGQGGQFAGVETDAVPDYSRDPAAFNAWAQKNGLGKNIGLKGLTVTATSSTSTRNIV